MLTCVCVCAHARACGYVCLKGVEVGIYVREGGFVCVCAYIYVGGGVFEGG